MLKRLFGSLVFLFFFFLAVPQGKAQSTSVTVNFGHVGASAEAEACFQMPEGSYGGSYSYASGDTMFSVVIGTGTGTIEVSASSISGLGTNCIPVFFTANSNATPGQSFQGSTTLTFTQGEGRNVEITISAQGTYTPY